MRRRLFIAAIALTLASFPAMAQFSSIGGEKASTKWNNIETPNYNVIYPVGLDSLGNRYATLLEYYRPKVGNTAGFFPNESYKRRMPVVLHPYSGIANGMVAWAPRRMELFTYPDAYGSLPPVPWETLLSIHENRHVAQLQFSRAGFWRWMSYPFGQFPAMLVGGVVANASILEGDAVVAETAFSSSGRGRTADFLAYYRMSFDNGDIRNWYRWRYGSQRLYTPDYYRIGYMTVAGARTLYDAPMFTSTYLHRATSPLRFNNLSGTMKSYSGKRLKKAWPEIAGEFASVWADDDKARGPFQAIEPIVPASKYFSSYSSAVETSDSRLFAVYSSLDRSQKLVEILPDGKVKSVRPFSSSGKLVYSAATDCIYWSEPVYSKRWDLEQDSRIKFMKVGTKKISDLTEKGRFVNPAVSPDGHLLAAAEYPIAGGSRIVLFNLDDGTEIRSMKAPDGLQVTEMAFMDGVLVFTGISDGGMGLYKTDFSRIEVLESAQPFKVKDMVSHDGKVYFTSDRDGTNEIYSYSAEGGLVQHTNTKYGVGSPFFRGGELHFCALQPSGRIPAAAEGSMSEAVSFADHAAWPIADALSAQEQAIEAAAPQMNIGEPARYSKMKNFLHVHSWIPFYYNYDSFKSSEGEYNYENFTLGATAFFQNLTGTASGVIGASFHENPFNSDQVRSGVHGRLRYNGLFPVIELAVDAGDRPSADVVKAYVALNDSLYVDSYLPWGKRDNIYVGGKATLSVPLNFSSGGLERSVEPFFTFAASNDHVGSGVVRYVYDEEQGEFVPEGGQVIELLSYMNFQAGLHASVQLPTAPSAILPRLGLGGSTRFTSNSFANVFYASAFAYLPGLLPVHGLKLSAAFQVKNIARNGSGSISDVWTYGMADMAPKGFIKTNVGTWLNITQKHTFRAGVDYAMPILPMDWNIGPIVYLRNMELNPFFDLTVAEKGYNRLYSVGTDIVFRFEKLFFASNTVKLGFRLAFNGGSMFDSLGLDDHVFFGSLVDVDLF